MKVLIVVVLYKATLENSQTIVSLGSAFNDVPDLSRSVQVLIWDNSPEPLDNIPTEFPWEYHHSAYNVGLAGAYNGAAALASQRAIPWLLLLDQDTRLPLDFVPKMLDQAAALEEKQDVAVIAPAVFVGDYQASPRRVLFNRLKPYVRGESGLAEGEAAAINSGSLLRVAALLEIGGYSNAFWLDYSDWYVHHQFFLHGKRLWRAADIEIQHSMTVMDYDNLMSTWRYNNFMDAEQAFNDLYKGRLENAAQTLRLLLRAVKQRIRYKDPEFSRITWRYFFKHLLSPRSTRIQEWEQCSNKRKSPKRALA